jgi:hypothetical protein
MNVNPVAASIAGAAASQQQAQATSETQQAQRESAGQERKAVTDLKAEMAAGIGQTDGEDHASSDRDADGRQVWQQLPHDVNEGSKKKAASAHHARDARDASGTKGNTLDLTA